MVSGGSVISVIRLDFVYRDAPREEQIAALDVHGVDEGLPFGRVGNPRSGLPPPGAVPTVQQRADLRAAQSA